MVMALYAPAHAQESTPPPSGAQDRTLRTSQREETRGERAASQQLQEVVVTGIRRSLESAQAIKQTAEVVVDSVTAQDIGALPDRSVAEALQRIPGVTLARTNNNRDPARLASEGGMVFIRGLSWVRSETNGRDIFSANNGRDLSFEDVSADLLAGVDVYKNPSAELIEGGIGGIVDLRTRLPFDSQRLLAFSGDYNYADLTREGFTSGNALYSDQWDVGENSRFGALFSVSIGNVGNRTDSIQAGRFEPRTLGAPQGGMAAGSTVYIPASLGWRTIDWEQKRTSIAAAFQFAPSEALTFTMQGMHGRAKPEDMERALGDFGGYPTDNTSYVFDDQGVLSAGTINMQPQIDTRYGKSNKTTRDYSFNVRYDASDNWSFSADVQRIRSKADVLSMTVFTQVGGFDRDASGNIVPASAAGGFDARGNPVTTTLDFDMRGDTPFFRLNQSPNLMLDPANYWWAAAMDHIEDNDATSLAERVDAEYTFDENPWLKSFRFGMRVTDKEAVTRQTGYNWGLLSHQYWGGGPPVYLTQTGFGNNTNAGLPGAVEFISYENFFRGNVNLPGKGWFPSADLVKRGGEANDLLKNTLSAGWGWVPLTTQSYEDQTPANDNPNRGINNQDETTHAAYMLLRYGHDTSPLGPVDGNIGVRVVKTQANASGVLTVAPITSGTPDACVATAPPGGCDAFISAFIFALGGGTDGFLQSHTYTDWLPSFNLRFHLTNDLQLRFAASRAMVRPTFSQMMPYTTLSFDFQEAPNNFTPDAVTPTTGTGGNPKLNPTRATQFDTSLEWYFAPTGSLTFAGFYKRIKDYIFLGQSDEEYTSNGITQTFRVTRNLNGERGKIQGFELGYQQFYDFLPGLLSGFGLQANFTYVDSTGGRNTAINILEPEQVIGAEDQTLPLEGLSKTSYNLTAMYERFGLSARLAYNWRERFLLTTSAANIQRPVWSEDYGQLDGSVFYNITPSIKLGLMGTNLLNTRTFLDVGGATLAPRYSWTDTDRRVAIAVRASF
jgi:TonB-dependent receptor